MLRAIVELMILPGDCELQENNKCLAILTVDSRARPEYNSTDLHLKPELEFSII
jgi:hypothetical protein